MNLTTTEIKLFKFILESDQTQEMLKEWAEDAGHGYPEELPLVDSLCRRMEGILEAYPEPKRKLLITEILEI